MAVKAKWVVVYHIASGEGARFSPNEADVLIKAGKYTEKKPKGKGIKYPKK